VDRIAAANRLLSPSYVSFEYALSYHGLIPERVYALGIQWLYAEKGGGRLIATPEKALCATLRAKNGLGRLSQKRVLECLEADMRIEPEDLFALDSEAIRAIAVAYGSPLLRELGVMIAKRRKTR
jgi:hypothetical protein